MSCASSWNRKARTWSATDGGGASSPFWPGGAGDRAHESFPGRWWVLGKMGLVAMILGFIVFWPIGIAVLFYNMFARKGGELPFTMPPGSHFWSRPTTGNSAFEEWRKAEIERIEQERKKLHEAEREFSVFLDELKRVKDREEFERFMKARKGWTGPEGEPKAEPAA